MMLQPPITAIILGALLGLRHATDADHVVAVTAIVARERSLARAAGIGALWGIGHTLTLLVVGGTIVAFRLVIPPRIGLGLEFSVALMLITLGFTTLRARDDAPRATIRPFLVGLVHGLAGSAAVVLLVLATIRGTVASLVYLFVFGLGTILGMMVVTMLLAVPAWYAGARVMRFQSRIRLVAGALNIVVGLLLARELIVDGGLFAEIPTWDPR